MVEKLVNNNKIQAWQNRILYPFGTPPCSVANSLFLSIKGLTNTLKFPIFYMLKISIKPHQVDNTATCDTRQPKQLKWY